MRYRITWSGCLENLLRARGYLCDYPSVDEAWDALAKVCDVYGVKEYDDGSFAVMGPGGSSDHVATIAPVADEDA